MTNIPQVGRHPRYCRCFVPWNALLLAAGTSQCTAAGSSSSLLERSIEPLSRIFKTQPFDVLHMLYVKRREERPVEINVDSE